MAKAAAEPPEIPEPTWQGRLVLRRREQRALALAACGASSVQITELLRISAPTTSRTFRLLRAGLRVDSFPALTSRALAEGLIDMDGPLAPEPGAVFEAADMPFLERFRGVTSILERRQHRLTASEAQYVTRHANGYSRATEGMWKGRLAPDMAKRIIGRLMIPMKVQHPFVLLWSAAVYCRQVEPLDPVPYSPSVELPNGSTLSIEAGPGEQIIVQYHGKWYRLGAE